MSKRIRVAVLFGGKSGEHEISLLSANSVMKAIDKSKYDVVPVGIDRQGRWLTQGDPMTLLADPQHGGALTNTESSVLVALNESRRELVPGTYQTGFPDVDVVFPVLHGTYGEDGTVQGLLELANLPYVGAGVTGSATGMDKAIFKDVMRAHGFPIPDHVVLKRKDWVAKPDAALDQVEAELSYPVFTKPANMGSSVGIRKCCNREELATGLKDAALYDRKLLVEYAVPAAREIEVSVLGNDEPIASVPGEIVPSREFYSYEAKYLDSGDSASGLLIPAPLDSAMAQRVRDMAIGAYVAIDCAGMARVDFLVSGETGDLYVNELNTIPGFTAISMYPKLWEATGISYQELIERLIDLALERFADTRASSTAYVASEA